MAGWCLGPVRFTRLGPLLASCNIPMTALGNDFVLVSRLIRWAKVILFWKMKSNIVITPLSSCTEEQLYKIMLKGIEFDMLSFLISMYEFPAFSYYILHKGNTFCFSRVTY
jgi:hypothetical protein